MSKTSVSFILLLKSVLLIPALMMLSGTTSAQSSAAADVFSEANQVLFFLDHLRDVAPPAALSYTFEKESDFDEDDSFTDTLTVNIREGEAGTKKAVIDYFSGTRNRTVPEFTNVTGNPLLKLALQRDIYHMDRLLGGSVGWRHFQKMIKIAFEESAEINERQITYQDKNFRARDIVIRPFLSDPLARRFPVFRNKVYTITLAEEIPGMIFMVASVVEADTDAAMPEVTAEGPVRAGTRITERFVLTES